MSISLRPAEEADEIFLFTLYCSTRIAELTAWGWPSETQAAFLRSQYTARRRQQLANGPLTTQIILCNGEPIGAISVRISAQTRHLVDITILPKAQDFGIGTSLLQDELAEAQRQQQQMTLDVLHSNPAQHLYRRLGFKPIADDGVYLRMQYIPAQD